MMKIATETVQAKMEEMVERYEKILITGHKNPDPDCYGSVLGLHAVLSAKYPEKDIRVALESNTFLSQITEGFTSELFQEEEHFLFIAVDTSSLERLACDAYKYAAEIIKIDHHPNDTPYGDLSIVDTSYASASEMVVAIFESELPHLLTPLLAKRLYFGIIGDTGRFLYPSVNANTLHFASLLVEHFEPKKEIHDVMANKSLNVVRLEGLIQSQFNVIDDVAYFVVDTSLLEEYNLSFAEASNTVNAMAGIQGINVWVLAIQQENSYRLRIRSKERPIKDVAVKYNGGGHPLASGASIEQLDTLPALINELANTK